MSPRRSTRTRFWPTVEQELLLRAAVLDGEAARLAYREWAARVDIEALDYGSYRLLPLLCRNVQQLGIDSSHAGRFRGAYRRALYQNTLTLRAAVEVLQILQEAGVDALVLKGVAMILLYYRALGVRPMSDVDILVRPEQVRRAIQALEHRRWYRRRGPPFTDGFFTVHYAWPFRHPGGAEVDLHWYLLDQSCFPDADADLWQAAVGAQIDGRPIRALSPADHLLHTCVHGAEWDRVPTVRWVADALAILRGVPGQLDWDRLVAQARKHGVVLPVHATLAYLREHFEAPIPAAVLGDLATAPTTLRQRAEFRWRGSAPRLFHHPLKIWFGYLRDRHARADDRRWRLLAFPRYLQRRWGTAHLWQVPLAGLALLAGELGFGHRPE
jgi:hypothetical protein